MDGQDGTLGTRHLASSLASCGKYFHHDNAMILRDATDRF